MATKKKAAPQKAPLDLEKVIDRLDDIESRFDMIDTPDWMCLKCGQIHVVPRAKCEHCGWKRP